jgi:hypothetical protein
MAQTRILVHENEDLIKKIDQAYLDEKTLITNLANNVIFLFTEFDDSYSETGSTTEKYLQFLEEGPQHYIDLAVTKIREEFAAAGVTSQAIIGIPIAQVYQRGNDLVRVYNELLQYTSRNIQYPELKFDLTDIEVVNGLAAIKNEKDMESFKDRLARQFIESEIGHALVEKAQSLVTLLNSINDILRANNIYNIGDLHDFGSFAKFKYPTDHDQVELELNIQDLYYNYISKINS